MLSSCQKTASIDAVRDFIKDETFPNGSFQKSLNVTVTTPNGTLLYENICIHIYYEHRYSQYLISVLWEEGSSAPDYEIMGLHGKYNTNFNFFKFTNGCLIFDDGDNNITIHYK